MSEPTQNKVIKSDSLEFLKQLKDYQADIIFADPPYALGSEVVIRQDGKVDYAKASDFMNKWEMPTGDYWEKWFIEAYRILKHGGYLLMYGMDRQLLLFKYYASLAGFQEQQSIYWYYISNFPKATDLSKMIDKNAGAEREKVKVSGNKTNAVLGITAGIMDSNEPITELAKKYQGYKYSVAPLKQTCETIMVFKKPNKTGSVLHDTLAMENGDDTITCSALNIDGNRVATEDNIFRKMYEPKKTQTQLNSSKMAGTVGDAYKDGRYPAQTFIDSQVAEKLDSQSGVNQTQGKSYNNTGVKEYDVKGFISNIKPNSPSNYGDTGGCSKILHKCDYEELDFDLFIYQPKVNSGERNNGLYGMEEKRVATLQGADRNGELDDVIERFRTSPSANNHPTLKPIDLNYKILNLFKTPNEQVIIYPFAGSGSEIIGGLKANFQNWYACEINQDYVDIANAIIKHYKENEYIQLSLI